jgi:hypothetical protein
MGFLDMTASGATRAVVIESPDLEPELAAQDRMSAATPAKHVGGQLNTHWAQLKTPG